MKAKLIVDGHEFDIEIQDPKLQKLVTPKKKTGYERSAEHYGYYFVGGDNRIYPRVEAMCVIGDKHYNEANYYSDKTVAENNARADKLMRQLRRFAVEHRSNDKVAERYYIYYLRDSNILLLKRDTMNRFIGPWFDNQHAGAQAIETFQDELIWYFTEYKDSL